MPVRAKKKQDISQVLLELSRKNQCPISAMADLTWRCNFQCKHCYQVKKAREELDCREWEKIFDKLQDAGVLMLTFSGGEPLIKRDFFDIALSARRKNFLLKLKTNGYLVDENIVSFLKDTAFEQVHLSFYSSEPEIHDFVTGVKGSHERVVEAVKLLRSSGIGVRLSIPVMKLNAKQIPQMMRFASKWGCECVVDPSLTVCEDGSCSPLRLRASFGDIVEVFRNRKILPKTKTRRGVRLKEDMIGERVCNVGLSSFLITPTGKVRPCVMIPVEIGDLKTQNLKEILRKSEFFSMLKSIRWCDLNECAVCSIRPWCQRCHGNALIEDGDLLGPSRIACLVAKARKAVLEERNSGGRF